MTKSLKTLVIVLIANGVKFNMDHLKAVLSPLLFLFYVNDLPLNIKSVSTLVLFVDDNAV